MAYIRIEKLVKEDVVLQSQVEFINEMLCPVTRTSLREAMFKNRVDYTKVGATRFVLSTPKSNQYKNKTR